MTTIMNKCLSNARYRAQSKESLRLARVVLALVLCFALACLSFQEKERNEVDSMLKVDKNTRKLNEADTYMESLGRTASGAAEVSSLRNNSQPKRKEDVSCGEVCDVDEEHFRQSPDKYYSYIEKAVDCQKLMLRMKLEKPSESWPPPRAPPAAQIEEMTMFGRMPIRIANNSYFASNNAQTVKSGVISKALIEKLQEQAYAGKNIAGGYGRTGTKLVIDALARYADAVHGMHGFVIGTEKPWIEALLLNAGADHITTIEYSSLLSDHPNILTRVPRTLAETYLDDPKPRFDFGVSYSSVEHSGLGRYGDEISPSGDLEAMAQAWCLTKPGGTFFLNVPYDNGLNYVIWNANRVYGDVRLKHLTANWHVVDIFGSGNKKIWVLVKPT